MRLVLVRHTPTGLQKGICYGQSEVDLAASWPLDFDRVAATLADLGLGAGQAALAGLVLITSPLGRCRRLSSHLAQAWGLDPGQVEVDPRLAELDFGSWELQSWQDIQTRPEAGAWFADPYGSQCPGGESWQDLEARLGSFLADLAEIPGTGKASRLIVSHGGPLRILHALCAGTEPSRALDLPWEPGQVRLLDWEA